MKSGVEHYMCIPTNPISVYNYWANLAAPKLAYVFLGHLNCLQSRLSVFPV